jgi:hypothetical protein
MTSPTEVLSVSGVFAVAWDVAGADWACAVLTDSALAPAAKARTM